MLLTLGSLQLSQQLLPVCIHLPDLAHAITPHCGQQLKLGLLLL